MKIRISNDFANALQNHAALVDANGKALTPDSNPQHPQRCIVLTTGETLECFPKATIQGDFTPDHMQLDTTGQYLAIGNKPIKKQPVDPNAEEHKKLYKLFTDNAFYLLAHRNRIMRDSRMFLTPIDVQNGLAYTGTSGFNNPTLGIYLEWWQACAGSMRSDKGRRTLVFHLAGSPLSGCNKCAEVDEDGQRSIIQLPYFRNLWKSFMRINTRYTEAKHLYQAFSLQQTLDILHSEDTGDASLAANITESFMQNEIDGLNQRVERLSKEATEWREKYDTVLMKYNEQRLHKAYDAYKTRGKSVESEIDAIRFQKRNLETELKSGRMDSKTYQQTLMPLNKRIKDFKWNLYKLAERIDQQFHADGITFNMIQHHIRSQEKQ